MNDWQKLGLTTINWRDLYYLEDKAIMDLWRSMRTTGFAVITGAGVETAPVYAHWREFFSNPERDSYRTTDGQTGYFPMRSENAAGRTAKDLKEFVHIFWGDRPNDTLEDWIRLSPQTTQLMDTCDLIASRVLELLEECVYGQEEACNWAGNSMFSPSSLLRILRYPPVVDAQPGEVRAAEHTDINMITVLPVATAPGLQVQTLDGRWVDVPYVPGSVVVNVGEMLEAASGGYYKATMHRVVTPEGEEGKERYSMPFFVHPRPDYEIKPGLTAAEALQKRLVELGLVK
jgi:isopenicillin N synthase-like dioxygenase